MASKSKPAGRVEAGIRWVLGNWAIVGVAVAAIGSALIRPGSDITYGFLPPRPVSFKCPANGGEPPIDSCVPPQLESTLRSMGLTVEDSTCGTLTKMFLGQLETLHSRPMYLTAWVLRAPKGASADSAEFVIHVPNEHLVSSWMFPERSFSDHSSPADKKAGTFSFTVRRIRESTDYVVALLFTETSAHAKEATLLAGSSSIYDFSEGPTLSRMLIKNGGWFGTLVALFCLKGKLIDSLRRGLDGILKWCGR